MGSPATNEEVVRQYLETSAAKDFDALVWRETVYWAEPFDAPDWRRGLVEVVDPPATPT
jgi:hypothetical protein